jgi:hypothetical protein
MYFMFKLLRHSRFWQGMALLIADGLFFGLTNPAQVVSMGLMVGFLLAAASLYYLCGVCLAAGKLYGLSLGRPRRVAAFAAGISAGLLALQSIGELSVRDLLVLTPLVLVLYIYLGYGRYKSAV